MARLLYGAGLLEFRVKDVDLGRGEITVREGKGDRDRRTMLPATLVDPLRHYLETTRTCTKKTAAKVVLASA